MVKWFINCSAALAMTRPWHGHLAHDPKSGARRPCHKQAVCALILLMLYRCSPGGPAPLASRTDGPLAVYVSIPPLAYLAERVGADHVRVRILVGPGQSPETYDPTPRQAAELSESDLFFRIGVPVESRVLAKLNGLGGRTQVWDLRENIELRPMENSAEHDRAHGADGTDAPAPMERCVGDPHVWLAPKNAGIITQHLCAALKQADPTHAEEFEANSEELQRDLEMLDGRIAAILAPVKGKRFYVYHPAFGYFGDAYGLEQVAVEIAGKEPTPRQLAALIEQARADGVRAILAQEQFPERAAQAVADAVGARVVRVDPLAYEYPAAIEELARALRAAIPPEDGHGPTPEEESSS